MSKKINIEVRMGEGVKIMINGQVFTLDRNGNLVKQTCATKVESKALKAFLEKLEQNTIYSVRQGLQRFLEKNGLEITENGNFLGYKAVRCDLLDFYSRSIKYEPGSTIETDVYDTDPTVACSKGLHVGTLDYAKSFGSIYDYYRILLVEVDPRDVVAVPYADAEKLRCKKLMVRSILESKCPEESSTNETSEDTLKTDPHIADLPSTVKIGRYLYTLKNITHERPKYLKKRKNIDTTVFHPVKVDAIYTTVRNPKLRIVKIGDIYAIYQRI